MTRRIQPKPEYTSSRSATRVNGNYKVTIDFDHNHRGRVKMEQDHDTTEWSNKSYIHYTVPNLRQNDS